MEPMKLIERADTYKIKGEHEILSAHARVAAYETDYKSVMSPQQKAWLMGCRSALAWALGLPKGGKKVEEMLEGKNVFGVVDPLLGQRTLEDMGIKLE